MASYKAGNSGGERITDKLDDQEDGMGLDTSHNCWHGSYGTFNEWRRALADVAGVPLDLMERWYEAPEQTAIEWAMPRDGGPMCGSYYGPVLHMWIEKSVRWLPIAWETLKPDVLYVLLDHSDCDGDIPVEYCAPIADRLEQLMPDLPRDLRWDWQEKTQQFIDGLRQAAAANEAVDFH